MFPYAVDHNNLLCNKQNERIACKDQHMYVCMCVCRACTCTWMLHMDVDGNREPLHPFPCMCGSHRRAERDACTDPNFNIGACPKLFFRPPDKPSPYQALCAETINTLNDALCDFYRTRCPGTEELECAKHVSDGKPRCENTKDDCEHRASLIPGSYATAAVPALTRPSAAAPLRHSD